MNARPKRQLIALSPLWVFFLALVALGSKWCTYCLIYSILFLAAPLWDSRRWKDDAPPASPVASRDDEETKEGDIESLVAAEERGKQQARDDGVEEGWHRFVAEQSGELA